MRLSKTTHQHQLNRPTAKTLSLAEIKSKATDAQRMSSSDIKNRASDDAIETAKVSTSGQQKGKPRKAKADAKARAKELKAQRKEKKLLEDSKTKIS